MRCTVLSAITLLAAGSAGAATLYDPQVAYTVVSGASTNLMLANADGTRAVKVASYRGLLTAVDFAPGGGRVAYLDGQGIKVLSYVASNTGITVTGVVTVAPASSGVSPDAPDFSPDGTRLAYVQTSNSTPQAVRIVSAATGAVLQSFACSPCTDARWLPAGVGDAVAYLHYIGGSPTTSWELWTALLNADGSVTAGPVLSTTTQAFSTMQELDVARTRNTVIFQAGYPTGPRVVEFDLATLELTDRGVGNRAHFNGDDSRIVSITPHSSAGDYVVSTDVATGVQLRITPKKGSYGTTDARP
jgi:hypothetical protein